uniref:Transmembrane protein 42a n=1 Tax=Cyprinus carpio TaxID=7962 RepID=A0A8C2AWZ4_CYPCA
MLPGVFYALIAGFLAALASSSAKLSLGAVYLKDVCETGLKIWTDGQENTDGVDSTACDWLHIPLRLLCGGLLFTCNAVMWTFFAKALRHSSSSARATVTTTASNFISSVSFPSSNLQIHLRKQLFNDLILSFSQAFLGHVIFGETHATLWWVGIILTLTGLYVLHGSTPQAPQENVDKKYD